MRLVWLETMEETPNRDIVAWRPSAMSLRKLGPAEQQKKYIFWLLGLF